MKKSVLCYLLIVAVWGTTVCSGADWNQFRGPNRDGKSTETGLLKKWSEGGPPLLWSCEGLEEGYASVSVVDGSIYTTGMNEQNQGYLFAIDNKGKLQWKKEYGPEWTGSYPGTRTTPTVDGDRIYVISGMGRLSCFSRKTKDLIWKVDTLEKFQGKNITWGISESVLIDGDKVICTPGGQQATIVALNKHTGETIWTTKELSNLSAYCSPMIVNHGDKRLLLTMVEKLFVCLDSQNGKVLWTIPHEIPYDIAPSSPVYEKGYVYFTGQIKGGASIRLASDGGCYTKLWTNPSLDTKHGGKGNLMIPAALNRILMAENRINCTSQCPTAIDYKQAKLISLYTAINEVIEQIGGDSSVFTGAFSNTQNVLVTRRIHAKGSNYVAITKLNTVDVNHQHVSIIESTFT